MYRTDVGQIGFSVTNAKDYGSIILQKPVFLKPEY